MFAMKLTRSPSMRDVLLAAALLSLTAVVPPAAAEKTDVVTLRNGDKLTGEIKKLERDRLYFRPDYTKEDIAILWDHVALMESHELFVFVLSNGTRYTGSMRMDGNEPDVIVVSDKLRLNRNILVEIQSIKADVWDRFKVELYAGYTVTKANNQQQLSLQGNVRYRTDRLTSQFNVNTLITVQNEGAESRRTEINLGSTRYVHRMWFFNPNLGLLKSDEQGLDLRSTLSLGAGRFAVRNALWTLSGSVGVAWTNEHYQDTGKSSIDSAELPLSIDTDIYGWDDFGLTSDLTTFASLTEKDRVRINFTIDLSWEIVKDLKIKINYFINTDNKPPEGASGSDYGLVSSFGWSL